MSCTCNYGYDESDGDCKLWREKSLQATRKDHKCCECSAVIPAGTRACFATWLYDGSWYTAYRCLSCSALAEFVAHRDESCPLWEGLREYCNSEEWDRFHA